MITFILFLDTEQLTWIQTPAPKSIVTGNKTKENEQTFISTYLEKIYENRKLKGGAIFGA